MGFSAGFICGGISVSLTELRVDGATSSVLPVFSFQSCVSKSGTADCLHLAGRRNP